MDHLKMEYSRRHISTPLLKLISLIITLRDMTGLNASSWRGISSCRFLCSLNSQNFLIGRVQKRL